MNEIEAARLAKAVAEQCLAGRVRRLNRIITGLYDRALQPLGLKINQANILVMLSLTGGATASDIAKVLVMEKSTVSRNLERMRKKGWIEVADKEAGLLQAVTVTALGRKLLAAAHTAWQAAQQQATELLGQEGVAAVMRIHENMRTK